jgi:iron complex outermembrane receptor protein
MLRLWVRNFALVGLLAVSAGAYGENQVGAASSRKDSRQQLKSLSLAELGNVQVTSFSKTPTEIWRTPAAVYLITSDDISRSGATTIADVLRLAPGVEVARLSSTTWAVGIRGLQNNFSKSVLVLVDGRNLYTPLFAGVYWDVQDMPLDTIDHIEVIRGPGGTIWGPNAANGVINIITKGAGETRGVTAHVLGGTEDRTIDDLQVGSRVKRVDFRVFGRGFERGHEYHVDGINDDAWHQERIGARVDAVSGRDTYFAEVGAYRGNSPHIVGTTPLYDETSGGDVNLRWQRDLKNGQGFYVQTYFERDLRTSPITLGEKRNTFDIDFIQHFKIADRDRLSYGGGLRWSPYQVSPPNENETLVPASATDHVYTGFVQDEVGLGQKVSLTLGAKLQHNNFSGFDIQPSARLLWALGEHQSLWVGISRAVTMPSDLDEDFFLQGGAGHTLIQVLGNKQFKSEDVLGYELGYRVLRGDRFYVDVSSFWSNYSNLQSFSAPMVTSSGGNTIIAIEYQNQIAGHTSGFEFAPQVTIAPWWRLNMSYSFVSSNFGANGATSDISSTGSVFTYERSTPRHMVSVQSKMDLPWKVQLNEMYRFASNLPAQKVEAYQTMDVVASRPLSRSVSIQVVGQNLFQPHHDEWGTGDPNQPLVGIYRAAYVQLSFKSGVPRFH